MVSGLEQFLQKRIKFPRFYVTITFERVNIIIVSLILILAAWHVKLTASVKIWADDLQKTKHD